jgi:prepilin-type processing-associated H-X9-DG protein
MASMFAAQAGFKLPAMLRHRVDHQGYEAVLPGRWLGADGLPRVSGPGLRSACRGGRAGVAMGVLMPALAKTRDLAYRKTSAANLSLIGRSCLIYANDHDDKLPPDLQTLAKETEQPLSMLESKRKPKDFHGPSYLYIPGQTVAMQPGNIVAYENPEYCTDGINVLFLDSHVEFMKPDAFRRELKETYERLGKPMPEIKFKGEGEGGAKPRPPRPPRPGKSTQA